MANQDPEAARSSRPIVVGIHDESDLVVLGVSAIMDQPAVSARVTAADLAVLAGADAGLRVDVVLCDPIGRDVDIEDYLADVAARTDARVIAYSWDERPRGVRRALAAGASGFVAKASSAAELVDAVEAVHRGESVGALDAGDAGPVLSARESEVLTLICRGLSNLEIADELYVSVNSVKTYIRQVYQKIEVTRRSQAVAWGLSVGY